jgi:hypothetical protein
MADLVDQVSNVRSCQCQVLEHPMILRYHIASSVLSKSQSYAEILVPEASGVDIGLHETIPACCNNRYVVYLFWLKRSPSSVRCTSIPKK